ncbi:hypothetical protein ACIRU8_43600 [Streptomyces sp. NPDC101175]|uniref:nSTAND1 domain-containing NTPase n=1 Tax=Streptomyces sp. NPDC101175 TaxID=3366123 RepID=UPI0038361376
MAEKRSVTEVGRPEIPLDPEAGPVQRFAHELRMLRRQAGGPTYRAMARRCAYASATLSEAAAGERLPSLPVALAYAAVCGGDAVEWERRWNQAAREEQQEQPAFDDGARGPYMGLARFEPDDHDRFFGRDRLTADLVRTAGRHRFTGLIGMSGSGKSSLLRAGLIPALRRADPSARPAAIRILTPGEQPAIQHAAALAPADGEGDTWVLVDQFEEVFTLCHDSAERAEFIEALLTALDESSRLRVVIAVRADFYGRCGEHHGLAHALQRANLLVTPMSREELREAIVGPAAADGLVLERSLSARIIDEVADEPGSLPLMSHALVETWRRRKGKTLTLKAYEAAGGIRGAIAGTAEQVYTGLRPEQAALARSLLLRLISPGEGAQDTRRPARHSELNPTSGAEADRILELLARARLVTLDDGTVDLAHEAVITAWPRLRDWIDTSRELLRGQRRLSEAAGVWDELGRDAGALYRGSRLAAAEEAFPQEQQDHFTPLEKAFLAASLQARADEQRQVTRAARRLRALVAGLAFVLVVALAATGTALDQRRSAFTAQRQALSRQLAAQSTALLSRDSDLASLLAIQAYRTSPTREATTSLYAAAGVPLEHRVAAHAATVDTVAFSPDGRTVATTGSDSAVGAGSVKLWDAATGSARTTLTRTGGAVWSTAFDRGGKRLVTAGAGGVQTWDLSKAHTNIRAAISDRRVEAVAFVRGRAVAVSATGRVWDVADGRVRTTLSAPSGVEMLVAFSPDGHTVATGGHDRRVYLSDLDTGRIRAVLTTESLDSLQAVAFSPDGHTVATGSASGVVRLWDAETGRAEASLTGHSLPVRTLAFGPDGTTLASGSDDGTVRLWDVVSRRLQITLTGHTKAVNSVVFSPDGAVLASGGRDGSLRLWNVAGSHPRATLRKPGTQATAVAFSPDNTTLAIGAMSMGLTGSGTRLWNTVTGKVAHTLPGGQAEASAAFSPDGGTVATSGRRETVHLWDPKSGKEKRSLPDAGTAVAYSPDGTTLATVRDDGTVMLWDPTTGRTKKTFQDKQAEGTLPSVVFNPAGTVLAVSGHFGRVRLWDVRNGHVLATLNMPEDKIPADASGPARQLDPSGNTVESIAFGPDGTTLATSSENGTVRLWNPATGRIKQTLPGAGTIVAFSPDGTTLAAGSSDSGSGGGTVSLLDIATGYARVRFVGHTAEVLSLAFSPDGHTLASADNDGTVQLWNVSLPSAPRLIHNLCDAVRRDITQQERDLYLPGQKRQVVCAP